ncbi:MFS transporter [Candidatus Nomurabacteria bacterium]|nr:MFS transporter [Candidatus Nomurabacteria bacterium]
MFKDSPKLKNIFLIGFLLSFHLALLAYINSSFLSSFISEKMVGLAYASGSLVSIIALLIAPHIFNRVGGQKFLIYISGLSALSLLCLAFAKSAYTAIPVFIIYFAINTMIFFSIDELLKIFSSNSSTGKIRGLYMAFVNLAWIITQIFSGSIIENYKFKEIYLIAFSIMILFFIASLFGLKNIQNPPSDKKNIIQSVKEFLKIKEIFRIYKINLLLQLFYCWMVIYTPIYLYHHLNFEWKEMGIIFAIMLLPFSIIPYQIGKYADKIGERKMLIFGFFVISLSTISLFFIHLHSIYIWAFMLFMTRVGASIAETMTDVYFFKHIKTEQEEFVSVFRSATPVAYIIGPIIAFMVFEITPAFKFIYLILGIIMLYGIYLSSKINKKDI